MTANITKNLILAAGLALGLAGAGRAQTAAAPAPAEPSYGLLGSSYAGLEYGYLHNDVDSGPAVAHEYGILYNQAVHPGLDFNVRLDEQRTTFLGATERLDEALAGVTAYQPVNRWLKPFVSAQGGVAWTQLPDSVGDLRHNSRFDYVLGAGAELQATSRLVFIPYADYQAIHRLGQDWYFGVKAAYRLTQNVSVTLTPSIDQDRNTEYQAGVNFHF